MARGLALGCGRRGWCLRRGQPQFGLLPGVAHVGVKIDESAKRFAGRVEIRKYVVDVKTRREGLVVSLREVGLYESGSSALRPSARDAIDRLAAILKSRAEMLRIEGHTDNIPIHNPRFDSNLELSTARFGPDQATRGYVSF
jgi:flagellar motor protein MotB